MGRERWLLGARHPEWEGEPPDFTAHYSTACQESFPIAGASSKKKFGPRSSRTCAFCGASEPLATFRNDPSHI